MPEDENLDVQTRLAEDAAEKTTEDAMLEHEIEDAENKTNTEELIRWMKKLKWNTEELIRRMKK